MKRTLIFCMVLLVVCAASLGIREAEAATYVSMLSTGTSAAWVECDYTTSPDVSGYYFYEYEIYLKDFDTYTLPTGYSYYQNLWALKVMNLSGNPVEEVDSPTTASGDAANWSFFQMADSSYYMWDADARPGDDILTGEQLNSMIVKSKLPPGYVDVAVWNGGTSTSASKTIGPVPEPASMALLGLSLLGLGSSVVRKRRKFKA